MTPAPKAISHGLGGGAGATTGAFAGISAANAGEAAEAASVAKSDNATFFIESAPFIRPARKCPADPLCLSSCEQSRQPPRLRSIWAPLTGKFRPVTARRGKPKMGATAAFLGELARYREKAGACCVDVTISARYPVLRAMDSAGGAQFSTWSHRLTRAGSTTAVRSRFRPQLLSCDWPRGASRPARQSDR